MHLRSRTESRSRRSGLGLPGTVALVGACLLLPAAVALASTVGIYTNPLNSPEVRSSLLRFGQKANCEKSGTDSAMRIKVGKESKECFYRVPVVGRNLEVSVIARLFKSTPTAIQDRTYVALGIRQSGSGARYQLAVFPKKHKFELRKVLANGSSQLLGEGSFSKKIKGMAEANQIRLRAFNDVPGLPASTARLIVWVNRNRLAVVDDPQGGELAGRTATISVGSPKVAYRAQGSFTGLTVRIPDPL